MNLQLRQCLLHTERTRQNAHVVGSLQNMSHDWDQTRHERATTTYCQKSSDFIPYVLYVPVFSSWYVNHLIKSTFISFKTTDFIRHIRQLFLTVWRLLNANKKKHFIVSAALANSNRKTYLIINGQSRLLSDNLINLYYS